MKCERGQQKLLYWKGSGMPRGRACPVTQSCLALWDPIDCSPPGSSVQGVIHARTLEWVAISFSKGSSQSRDWTHVSCIGRRILYHSATWEAYTTTKRCYLSCCPSTVKMLKASHQQHSVIITILEEDLTGNSMTDRQTDWSVKRQKWRHQLGSYYNNLDKKATGNKPGEKRPRYNMEVKIQGTRMITCVTEEKSQR